MSDTTLSPLASAAEAMFVAYKASADDANILAGKIKAATSGVDDAINSVVETSDDSDIAAYREWSAKISAQIEAANAALAERKAAIREHAKTLVAASGEVDGFATVEDARTAFLAKRENATNIRKGILGLLGGDTSALNAGVEAHGITEVVSLRGNTVKGAEGVRKPRLVSATVNGTEQDGGTNDDGTLKPPTFTTLAKSLGVTLDTLKAATNAAAGTDDLMSLPEGTNVTFDLPLKDNTTATVVVVPKHRD